MKIWPNLFAVHVENNYYYDDDAPHSTDPHRAIIYSYYSNRQTSFRLKLNSINEIYIYIKKKK